MLDEYDEYDEKQHKKLQLVVPVVRFAICLLKTPIQTKILNKDMINALYYLSWCLSYMCEGSFLGGVSCEHNLI